MRLLKLALVLLGLSFMLGVLWFSRAVLTGIAVPYPDPTLEQVTHEKFHLPISLTLFFAAVLSCIGSLVAGLVAGVLWLIRRRAT